MKSESFKKKQLLIGVSRNINSWIYLFAVNVLLTDMSDEVNQDSTSPVKLNKDVKRKPKQYSCEVCDKLYSEKGNLKKHMAIHFDKKTLFMQSV